MLDTIFNEIINELALEGDQGCSIDNLFVLIKSLLEKSLSSTKLIHPLCFNTSYKIYLWNQLRDHEQIIITKNGTMIDPNQYSLEELESEPILVKTTEEAQDRNIYGSLRGEKKNLTDKHKLILNTIAKARQKGILQVNLGEMLHMDTKTVFHYLKKLDQLGLIVKKPVCISKMNTNMLLLKRFADEENEEEGMIRIEEFKQKVIDLISNAEDGFISLYDTIQSFGFQTKTQSRWARDMIMKMHTQGELEKFIASDGKKQRVCIRRISNTPTPTLDTTPIKDTTYRDMPIDYQIYRDIVVAGKRGLTRQDMMDKYQCIDPDVFKSILESIVLPPCERNRQYQVFRTEEIVGKTRVFRYFCLEGMKALKASIHQHFEEPVLIDRPNHVDISEPASMDEIGQCYRTPGSAKRKYAARETSEKKRKLAPPSNKRKAAAEDVLSSNKRKAAVEDVPKKTKRTELDLTKERRRTLLLEMLETQRIMVMDETLVRNYQERERDAGYNGIARTSLNNMIKKLHSDKKLTLFVTSVNTHGTSDIKTLLLHPSLKPDSEEVAAFIDSYDHSPFMQATKKIRKLEVVDVKSLPEDQPRENKMTFGQRSTWRYTAIEHGWINSKWLRARKLHEAMFAFADHTGKVDMNDFLKKMPLQTLMSFFGALPYDDARLAQFLETEENRNTPINDLPPDIKRMVVTVSKHIKLNVIRLLNILEALGLFESYEKDDTVLRIVPELALSKVVDVRDYKLEGHPVRTTLELKTHEDVQAFWMTLQSICTEFMEDRDVKDNPSHPLHKITLRRGWNTNTLLTAEQKKILNTFIDYEQQTVPDEQDVSLRSYIMKKTQLPLSRIKTYYQSILIAFQKYQTKREKEERRKQVLASAPPAIQELMQAAMEKRKVKASLYKLKSAEPFVEQTYIGSRKLKRLNVLVRPEKLVPRSKREPFTAVEKEALVHAYCIMKSRAEASQFLWSPIVQVIPNHTPERCRRVLQWMMASMPELNEKIRVLKEKWAKIYKRGIETKELKDENPWETVHFDLVTFLEYFITQLQNESAQPEVQSYLVLPRTLSQLRNRFITRKTNEGYDSSLLLWNEMNYDTLSKPPLYDKRQVEIELVGIAIKMILMAPEDQYDSKNAFNMLTMFGETRTREGIERLKENGVIVNDRMRHGRIPGRHINVSEKFVNMSLGVLPYQLLAQARQFYNRLVNDDDALLNSDTVDSGTVAAVLDLLSQAKIYLDFKDRDTYINSKQSLCYPKAKAVQSVYIYKNLDIKVVKREPLKKSIAQDLIVKTPMNGNTSEDLSPKETMIYHCISEFKERGASWSDIKKSSQSTEESLSDGDLNALLDHLLDMKLVQLVGFDCLRYVSTDYISSWLLKNHSYPLIWYQVTGELIQPVLEGCAETVMSHIIQQPGVSFATLRKKLTHFLNAFELYHLLAFLQKSGKIRSQKVRKPMLSKQSLLFSQRTTSSTTSHQGMNDHEVTHYWALSNYYL